jgi:hypothetical protein
VIAGAPPLSPMPETKMKASKMLVPKNVDLRNVVTFCKMLTKK